MKLLKIALVCCGILLFFPLHAQDHQNAVIGFYNLENLFDTINDPNKNDG